MTGCVHTPFWQRFEPHWELSEQAAPTGRPTQTPALQLPDTHCELAVHAPLLP